MFLAYWPVLAFVASVILISVLLTLKFAGNLCGARHTALPERSLETYLPASDQPLADLEFGLATSELPPGSSSGNFDQGFDYNLDTSLSPEGRREYGV